MYNTDEGLATGYMIGSDRSNNNGWGDGAGWLWIIVLFALFGWGGNGFGGFGGNNGVVTRSDLCESFNFNSLDSAVRGVQQGLCDGFYAMNTSLLTGFNGVERGIADLGFNLQNCCCQTQRAIDGVNYNLATSTCALQNTMNSNTRDIILSQQAGTQRILDYLCQEKISGLQAENAALTAQLSQNAQTNTIVNALRPTPVPAFPASNLYGFYGRDGYGSGCGCNSCGL